MSSLQAAITFLANWAALHILVGLSSETKYGLIKLVTKALNA
jgi:hypothetical protein